jgi:hypothetical protein
VACQIAFDLVESATQQYLRSVIAKLKADRPEVIVTVKMYIIDLCSSSSNDIECG